MSAVRALAVGGVTAALMLGSACGAGRDDAETDGGPSPRVSASDAGGDTMREALVAGLEVSSPSLASLVRSPQTTVTPVRADFLSGWQIVDVQSMSPPHPRRAYLALADSGRVEVLSGHPDAFASVMSDAEVEVTSGEDAVPVAKLFLDVTRDFRRFSYRIDSIDDVKWRPGLDGRAVRERESVRTTYAERVATPKVAQVANGWVVRLWTVTGTDLVRHDASVSQSGSVTDQPTIAEKDLPVPVSL